MNQSQKIEAPPWQRMMRTARRTRKVSASIRLEEHCIQIELSDGLTSVIAESANMSHELLLASAVQWARRHGATSITVDYP